MWHTDRETYRQMDRKRSNRLPFYSQRERQRERPREREREREEREERDGKGISRIAAASNPSFLWEQEPEPPVGDYKAESYETKSASKIL
ncbi:jg11922 [Pararge aegeria aegeria]|uniref:Jg11922 protein n=1 Tax=Pararge aegeria aegeria TaxID=348720 RepID=A0A8S4SBG4_9NEOP|nr:jg11922 [Pararge aegeria aegeria]